MSLPELVAPVIAVGGTTALIGTVLRFGPDAALRLLAGTVAVLTHDDNRGKRCLEVLSVLQGNGPWRRRSGSTRQRHRRARDHE